MKLLTRVSKWCKEIFMPSPSQKTLDIAQLLKAPPSPIPINETPIKLVKIGQIDLKGESPEALIKALSMIDGDNKSSTNS